MDPGRQVGTCVVTLVSDSQWGHGVLTFGSHDLSCVTRLSPGPGLGLGV